MIKMETLFERIKNHPATKVVNTFLAGAMLYTGLYMAVPKQAVAQTKEGTKLEEKVEAYKPTMAVGGLEARDVKETSAKNAADVLITAYLKTGKLRVLDRANMEDVLKEQEFQMSGCLSTECMVEMGKLLSMQYIVGGSFGKEGGELLINMQVIDVETGKIIYSQNEIYINFNHYKKKVRMDMVSKAANAILADYAEKHGKPAVEDEMDKVLKEPVPVKKEEPVKKKYEKPKEEEIETKDVKEEDKKKKKKHWYFTWYGMTGIGLAAALTGYGVYALTKEDKKEDTPIPPADDGPTENTGDGDDKDGKDQEKTVIGVKSKVKSNNYKVMSMKSMNIQKTLHYDPMPKPPVYFDINPIEKDVTVYLPVINIPLGGKK